MSTGKNSLINAAFFFMLVLFLSSCASTSKKISSGGFLSEKRQTEESIHDKSGYILGPDDVVRLEVEQHPEWNFDLVISPEGRVEIPGLGNTLAQGFTKEQLAINISARLEQYMREPKVTIAVTKYASQVIFVFGEVNLPGKYPTEGKTITLRDAVIIAGLPKPFAALNRVFVMSPSEPSTKHRVINLQRILYQGELKMNITLNPGDIVYVPTTVVGILNEFLSSLLSPLSSAAASATRTTAGVRP